MKTLYLYNTLNRKKEEFRPINTSPQPSPSKGGGVVGLYTCGPTVYNYAHIGNMRAYIFADLLARTLRYNYGEARVKWVMNITDVDDKTIRDSKIKYPNIDPNEALKKFTAEYEKYFWEDMEKLNIKKPDVIPHAADQKYVEKMQDLINKIVKAGYGYIKDGSVYFDVAKYYKNYKYGKLINLDMDGFKAGVRIDADEYEKENVQDFVLWKNQEKGDPFWDYELDGKSLPGRPGWHIECSAMGQETLGMPFDIHTGGIDLKFPHHENEIAQSVIGYNVDQPVNYWLHNEYLLVDGVKMSKRYKNFYTLRDLEEKGFNPFAFRYLCMQTHYGKQMNFTFNSLKAAEDGLKHLKNQVRELGDEKGDINSDYKNNFFKAINDDLNLSKALAVTQEMLKSDLLGQDKLATVLDFDKVLGLKLNQVDEDIELPEDIKSLVAQRVEARVGNNYNESDRLRAEIEKRGYLIDDTKDGMRVVKK
ncbi:cysteine--tRNA ligase [Candidatus Parcubacteria bacterium]|nr:cysteine--tRNA ligase [Candidatus Parcubacteria bacterium]